MASVHLDFGKKLNSGKHILRLSYKCEDGKRYRHYFKESVLKSHVKNGRIISSSPGSASLNAFIEHEVERIKAAIRTIRIKGHVVTKQMLISELCGETRDFWSMVDFFHQNPPIKITSSTMSVSEIFFKHLRDFENAAGIRTEFRLINQEFIDEYVQFRREACIVFAKKRGIKDKTRKALWGMEKAQEYACQLQAEGWTTRIVEQNINDNTIVKELKRLRAFNKFALKKKVIKVLPEFEISARGLDSNEVALSPEEIRKIYQVAHSQTDEFVSIQLEHHNFLTNGVKIRNRKIMREEFCELIDYFVLGTQLGIRVGDFKIDPSNVIQKDGFKYLDLRVRKTTFSGVSAVIVPVASDLAFEILERHKWSIKDFDKAALNRYVKHAAREAGLNERVISRSVKGGHVVEIMREKWEMVSSHTMRRSYATNAYRAGIDMYLIMKITGHKTIKSFLRYIRISNQEAAEIIGAKMRGLQ